MDATDAQFQRFVQFAGIPVNANDIPEWSFDDRCRVINHALKYGVSLPFANENSSVQEQKQLSNNSETIRSGELFVASEQASQVHPGYLNDEMYEDGESEQKP